MIRIGLVQFDDATVRQYARVQSEMRKQAAAAPAAAGEAAKRFTLPRNVSEWLTAGLALSAAGAAMGLGAQGVGLAAGKVGDAVHAASLNKQFGAMLKADPSLAEDKTKAKQYFSILHRASPYLAGEPTLAASTVKGMMEYGHAPGDQLVKGILETESRYQDTRHPYLKPKVLSMPTGMSNVGGG